VFEGADLCWVRPDLALLAVGFRTNESGAEQVTEVLKRQGVSTVRTTLPPGTMHLMGQLRIVDTDLALGWPGRLPDDARDLLESQGVEVVFIPDEHEAREGFALNFVTLGPRSVLMPGRNPHSRAFYEGLGLSVRTVPMDAVGRAAGSIGCLTGVVARDALE
jgi:N-dimethylarginine dimethylaminohydrolase